jgi:hypothetical protein
LLHGLGRLKLPMPRTTRELFELFALYHPTEGLNGLLNRLDFSEVKPLQIYQVVHGRAPERIELVVPTQGYRPREHLKAALLSDEFRTTTLRKLLVGFPEKRRDVFIHIPKCAGTDLILNLGPKRLLLPKMVEVESWVSIEEFFEALKGLAQAIPYYDAFFVYGHMILGEYIGNAGIRAGDRIFSVLREPTDIMLSQANYAITRLRQDPLGKDPDTREILGYLGIDRLPHPVSVKDLRELAMRALLHPGIAQPNRTCFYLGNPDSPTYAAAMTNVVMHDVELTTTQHYAKWLAERWDIAAETHSNVSDHWLTRDDVTADIADQLRARTAEGQKMFDVVSCVLEQRGTASVTGSEIAETVGAGLLDAFPEELTAERPRPALGALQVHKSAEITVVQGNDAIASYLRNRTKTEGDFSAVFGQGGNGKAFLREGWANPEAEFVWTAAPVSRLEIPKPGAAGDYRLRLIARPFIAKDRLPTQRFSIAVNGVVLGGAAASERALIECDLPGPVLGGNATTAVTLTIPDAVRPSEVSDSSDVRRLGFAIEWLELLQIDRSAAEEPPSASQAEPVSPAPLTANGPATKPEAAAPAVRDLMMRFESLGESCEFGLVQRRCEAEPLGLFRFASAPLPKLLAALGADFAGFGEPEALDVELSANGREYMIKDKQFGLLYHAWVMAGEMTPEEVHQREIRRLPLLIRKLREDLAEGEKIFVYHGMGQLGGADALPLVATLRRYGPNTLLWVELADADHPAGTVEPAGAGLLKSYIDRFAPGEDAHDLSLDCWIAICREAWRLHHSAADTQPGAAAQVRDFPTPPQSPISDAV